MGFNSGRYDLNLIKNSFVERLVEIGKVGVVKKGGLIMFLRIDGFLFLDVINYLGLGTSYDSWTKVYGCE